MKIKDLESVKPPDSYPLVLADSFAIADYVQSMSSDDVDYELITEHYRGCKAVLKLVPISSLHPGNTDHNVPSATKEKRYAKMKLSTIPPLLVDDGEIADGNHRYRVAVKLGEKQMWCYVIEEI